MKLSTGKKITVATIFIVVVTVILLIVEKLL